MVEASAAFSAAHSTDERKFLLAAGSAGIEAATNIVVLIPALSHFLLASGGRAREVHATAGVTPVGGGVSRGAFVRPRGHL